MLTIIMLTSKLTNFIARSKLSENSIKNTEKSPKFREKPWKFSLFLKSLKND